MWRLDSTPVGAPPRLKSFYDTAFHMTIRCSFLQFFLNYFSSCIYLNTETSVTHIKKKQSGVTGFLAHLWRRCFVVFFFVFKSSLIIPFMYYHTRFQVKVVFRLYNVSKVLSKTNTWPEQECLFCVGPMPIPNSHLNCSFLKLILTTPIKSPRPYSPVRCFFPSSIRMTERSRPFNTMYVQSDLSPCLQKEQPRTSIH